MLTLPKSILEELACSNCKKYLSVPPIKVYPNRQVKCGRCCQEDDGGTSSSLYQTVVKNIKFPCIRHMEGCHTSLSMSEMKNHEASCHGKKYCCPACNKYEDYSYELAIHIEKEHKDLLLKNAEFLLTFDKTSATSTGTDETLETRKYFYYDHNVLLFIFVSYNSKMLYLQLHVVGNDEKPASAEYSLFSIENKLLYEGKTSKCAKWGDVGTETMTIDITSLRFPKNIMFFKFQVFREYSALLPIDHTMIIDPSAMEAIFRCEFKNISSLGLFKSIFAKEKYYVNNKPCRVEIKKIMCDTDPYLSCYLKIDNIDESFKAYVKFSLFCQDEKGNKEMDATCPFTSGEHDWGFDKFIKWETVTNVTNGYLTNNSIKIDVKIKILQPKSVYCYQCNIVRSKQ